MGNVGTTALGIVGSVHDYNEQVAYADSQKTAAITQMNFTFSNYEAERQDAFDQAVEEIASARQKANNTQATLKTALGEQLGSSSHTAKALERVAEGKEGQVVSQLQDNYQRKSNEIDLNKESALISTRSYLSKIKNPSMLGLVMNVGSQVVATTTEGNKEAAQAAKDGVDFNWEDYWLKGSGTSGIKRTTTGGAK